MEAVTVVARFRGAENGIDDMGEWQLTDSSIKHNEKHHEFNFDAVLNPSKSQAELYEAAGRKMINFFCDGYNGTIFAYGQSGSGKTFSMLGPEEVTEILINSKDNIPEETAEMFGITPRATFHVFDNIKAGQEKGTVYTLKCSYVEVYNEMINDILSSPPGLNLKLREFPNAGMCVIGLREDVANTPEAVFQALSNGTANRVVCSTGQNARSSRSHTVFIMSLEQKTADGTVKSAKINLVDLAGSEKLSKTGAQGQSLTEAKNINLSLTTLGRCIKALTSGSAEFVPYRESKLTLILKESLSGAAMTTLIVTGSMRKIHQEETIGTMQFAERAKMVKTKAKSNTKRSYEELEKLFTKLSEEVKVLKAAVGGGVVVSIPSTPSEAPQAAPEAKTSEVDTKALEEIKGKFEELKSKSLKEIEGLTERLKKAEASQNQIDYLEVHEEMEGFRDKLDDDNKKLAEVSAEKEKEMVEFEKKITEIVITIENAEVEIAQTLQEIQLNSKEIEELEKNISQKDSESEELIAKGREIKEKKKKYEEKIQDLEDSIKKQGADYPELYKEIEKIKTHIDESHEKKQEIDEKIDKLKTDFQESVGKSLLLQKKENQHRQDIEKFSEEKTELEKNLSHLVQEKKEKKIEILKFKTDHQRKTTEKHQENAHLLGEVNEIKFKLSDKKKGNAAEFNEQKIKLAEEQARPIQEEIAKLKQSQAEVLAKTQASLTELEVLKQKSQKETAENLKLKEDLKKDSIALAKTQKEISDEKSIKSRITKNIKAFNESLAQAIQEAHSQAKTQEQFKITEYVQEINVLQNELDKKERYIEESKKSHLNEMKKFKNELEEIKNNKKTGEEKLEKAKHDLENLVSKNELEKKTAVNLLNSKNDEIVRLKELISANEAKINLGLTQIEKLEADVRHKAAERDIERKNTMRNTIVPRKMSVFQAQIPKPEESKSFHGVQLKKTDNKHLNNAIQESKKNQGFHEMYKVVYEFQAIKSLYANIDVPQVDDSMFIQEGQKESSDSDSEN